MSPQSYIQARKQRLECVKVDERPYLAVQRVDVSDMESVRVTVARMFMGEEKWQSQCSKEATRALQVKRVQGGITNTLFYVSGLRSFQLCDYFPDGCLVRVFGAEGMIDRDVENCLYAALSKASLSPPYWGRFQNGRVEGWMNEMRPLQARELSNPVIAKGIAVATARFHTTFAVPQTVQDHLSSVSGNGNQEPSMWPQLQGWLQQAIKATFQTANDTKRAQELDLPQFEQELQWLRESVIPVDAEAVFCHNDLLAANVLYDDKDQRIQLIDFEYGALNYRSFDIANHFNEYAGGSEDGHTQYDWFPTAAQQTHFISAYLTAAGDEKTPPTPKKIQETTQEVQAFVLANHLYWGIWAVNQAAVESCREFDFLLYAGNRIGRYWECKKEWP